MGLAQREIEAAQISTITLSTMLEVTSSVGAPRVAGIEYPVSLPLGNPGDRDDQMAVLRSLLRALEEIDRPGGAVCLPHRWPEGRPPMHPLEPPPIVKLLKRRPWLYAKLLSGDIP